MSHHRQIHTPPGAICVTYIHSLLILHLSQIPYIGYLQTSVEICLVKHTADGTLLSYMLQISCSDPGISHLVLSEKAMTGLKLA